MPGVDDSIKPVDVRRAAMNLLARREHARSELVEKLSRRFNRNNLDMIDAEIDRLTAEGLQSDARLAESFVRARAGRGHGPVKIKAELRGKGVGDDTIALAFSECEVDWFAKAEEVALKRFGPNAPANAAERARRSRFLQQRGFSFDHVSEVLKATR